MVEVERIVVCFMTVFIMLWLRTALEHAEKSADIENAYSKVVNNGNVPFMFVINKVLNKEHAYVCIIGSITLIFSVYIILKQFKIESTKYLFVMLGFINFIIYGKIIDFYRWHIIAYGGKQIGDLATYGMITNNKQFDNDLTRHIIEDKRNFPKAPYMNGYSFTSWSNLSGE